MLEKMTYPAGQFWRVTLAGWCFDLYDWSLSRDDPSENIWHQRFALKCADCRRWTAGCKDHWFCGLDESCRQVIDEAEDDD